MIKLPKKSLFEGKNKFLGRVAEAFETQAGLDALNAHYAALFWQKAKSASPEIIVAAIKSLNVRGGDVANLNEINDAVNHLKDKH